MTRIRVSWDWDGTLCDFNGQSVAEFGAPPRELTFECPQRGYLKGDEALWAHVDSSKTFWTEAKVFYGTAELVEITRPYGHQVITGCPSTGFDRAAEEKTAKINTLFPDLPVITCRSKDKVRYMQEPGDILIDDFVVNIRRWQKAGGYGIYYKSHKQAIYDLKKGLLRQFPEIVPPWKADFEAEIVRAEEAALQAALNPRTA